jgi:hypothetical protein
MRDPANWEFEVATGGACPVVPNAHTTESLQETWKSGTICYILVINPLCPMHPRMGR